MPAAKKPTVQYLVLNTAESAAYALVKTPGEAGDWIRNDAEEWEYGTGQVAQFYRVFVVSGEMKVEAEESVKVFVYSS
jgi:hypothetical protein